MKSIRARNDSRARARRAEAYAVVHINKDAYYFVLDAQTGKPLISAPETPVPQDPVAHTYR